MGRLSIVKAFFLSALLSGAAHAQLLPPPPPPPGGQFGTQNGPEVGPSGGGLGSGPSVSTRTGSIDSGRRAQRDRDGGGRSADQRRMMPLSDLIDYMDEEAIAMPGYNHDIVTGYGNDLLWLDTP